MTYEGGYYRIRQPLLKAGQHAHTSALENPISDTMLRALNLVQATAWRINTAILDVMAQAWREGATVGDIPPADNRPIPPRIPEARWASMSKQERGEYKAKIAVIHGDNARLVGKRQTFRRKLHAAEELRAAPAIWFPHSMDFRGRLYPLPQDLNPQGDDIAKALLLFATGKPLGERGAYWLAIRLANTYGQDKLPFAERVQWVYDNEKEIIDSAKEPLDGRRFWTRADEPWCFLAGCIEWRKYRWFGSTDYVSSLPVNLDGSTNGLQHLSAMGRDPVGARETNLTAASQRHDLYAAVAEAVKARVSRDVAQGVEEAKHWLGRVDRKTVKRAVMTTPYGVTPRGIRDQLIADRHVSDLEGHPIANADYLRDGIVEALKTTCMAATGIMGYMQGVAKALSDADLPLSWTTPAGLRVQQSYYEPQWVHIRTLFGSSWIWREDQSRGLNTRKQTLASAPNVIHSFDAAHLALTVIDAHDNHGLEAFSFIHDSYGTLAADVDTLASILRRQFVEMYREDRLAQFEQQIQEYAPDVQLPERPAPGTFDIEEVLRADYFFS